MADIRKPLLAEAKQLLAPDSKLSPLVSEKSYALVDVDETLIQGDDPHSHATLF